MINISSIAGHIGLKRQVPYCATKGGVEQLTNVETLQFTDQSIALADFYEANKVGNTTNDSVTGTDGADALFGYGGNDTLMGGRGDDVRFTIQRTG